MADIDPGLLIAMQQATGGGGTGGGGFGGANQPLGLADIQALLLGTVRQQATRQPLIGPMPLWVPGSVREFVQQGVVDPYLGATGGLDGYRVYMGTGRVTEADRPISVSHKNGDAPHVPTSKSRIQNDKTYTMQQALNEPFTWDQTEVADAIKKFRAAGRLDVKDFDSLKEAWDAVVQRAGQMYSLSSGERKVTPWDVLDLYKSEQAAAGVKVQDPNGSVTTVRREVTDVNEGEAWAKLTGTVTDMLGREPSDQEVRDFTYRMSNLASRNPTISTTVSQLRDGEVVSQNVHKKGGFSEYDMAQGAYENAQADPDYAEYQSATTYFNAALSALGAIGG